MKREKFDEKNWEIFDGGNTVHEYCGGTFVQNKKDPHRFICKKCKTFVMCPDLKRLPIAIFVSKEEFFSLDLTPPPVKKENQLL